jgi:hypothetical protein
MILPPGIIVTFIHSPAKKGKTGIGTYQTTSDYVAIKHEEGSEDPFAAILHIFLLTKVKSLSLELLKWFML